MDSMNMKLINRLQKGLPLEMNPYGLIGEELGIPRSEVLARIKGLVSEGYIRRIGGSFDTRKMGYTSILMGANVPEHQYREIASHINAVPGVTHNYRRSGFLNMWFTLSVMEPEEKEGLIQDLRTRFAITEIYEFPKLRNYKLHVFFDMEGK